MAIDTVAGSVKEDISLDLGVEKSRLATVMLKGSTALFSERMVNLGGLKGEQHLELQGIELGELKPLLDSMGLKVDLRGTINGLIDLRLEGPGDIATVQGKVELSPDKGIGRTAGG